MLEHGGEADMKPLPVYDCPFASVKPAARVIKPAHTTGRTCLKAIRHGQSWYDSVVYTTVIWKQ